MNITNRRSRSRQLLVGLVLLGALAAVPIRSAYADATFGSLHVAGDETACTYANGTVTITKSSTLTFSMATPGQKGTDSIVVGKGVEANLTFDGVDIDESGDTSKPAMELVETRDGVTKGAIVKLTLKGTNKLTSAGDNAGLQIQYTDHFVQPGVPEIDISGPGSLTATCVGVGTDPKHLGAWGAGIGGSYHHSGGNINIESGTVTGVCDGRGWPSYAAGIGGGAGKRNISGDTGSVKIFGGTVEGKTLGPKTYGAGIGSGQNGVNTGVTISGGTVTASNGDEGTEAHDAAIGSNFQFGTGRQGVIAITGGTVNAYSQSDDPGIGDKYDQLIKISGGRFDVSSKNGKPIDPGNGLNVSLGYITGGCFAGGQAAGVKDRNLTDCGYIYNLSLRDPHVAWHNIDPATKDKYPYRIYNQGKFQIAVTQNGGSKVYDGTSLALKDFTLSVPGGEVDLQQLANAHPHLTYRSNATMHIWSELGRHTTDASSYMIWARSDPIARMGTSETTYTLFVSNKEPDQKSELEGYKAFITKRPTHLVSAKILFHLSYTGSTVFGCPPIYPNPKDVIFTFDNAVEGEHFGVMDDYEFQGKLADANAGPNRPATVKITNWSTSLNSRSHNYSLEGDTVDTTIDVDPGQITIKTASVGPKVYDATTVSAVPEVTFGGLASGEKLVAGTDYDASGAYADARAATDKDVTVTVTLKEGSQAAANYKIAGTITTKADITRRPITVGSADIATRVYDGTTKATVSSVTFKNLAGDDQLAQGTDYQASAAFGDARAASGKDVPVDVELLEGGPLSGNYILSGSPYMASGDISRRPLQISEAKADSKVYDATTDATVSDLAFSNLVAGEQLVSGDDYTASGTFADSHAGADKEVSVTAKLSQDSSVAANYTLDGAFKTTATIERKPIEVSSAKVDSKVFDGNTSATVSDVAFSGLVGKERLAPKQDYTVAAAFSDAAVGKAKRVDVTISLIGEGPVASNYLMDDAHLSAKADITPADSGGGDDGGKTDGGGTDGGVTPAPHRRGAGLPGSGDAAWTATAAVAALATAAVVCALIIRRRA